MLYIIVTLALVIVVPVSFKLGQRRGVRLEQQKRWFNLSELDDLTPREALGLASQATKERTYGGSGSWEMKLKDATTGAEFTVSNPSLPDLISTTTRHFIAQRTLKQLETGS